MDKNPTIMGVSVFLPLDAARAAAQGLQADILSREGDEDLEDIRVAEQDAYTRILQALGPYA